MPTSDTRKNRRARQKRRRTERQLDRDARRVTRTLLDAHDRLTKRKGTHR